ncbi:MAG: cbb3-type cytochrome c oxidase subunit II [Chthoniobacterales bacterium]
MKGLVPLVLGIFGTFAFSWGGLVLVPSMQIGHLDPQMDEEGADVYPAPRSGLAERGRRVYIANGCVYCHSQQVRPDYAGSDIERKWGTRRSAPRDYLFDRPALLGRMRIGPDLANIGKRAPLEDAAAPPPDATNAPGAAPTAPAAPAAAAAAPPPTGQPLPTGSASAATSPTASNAPAPQVPPAPGSAPSPAAAVIAPTAVATAPGASAAAPSPKGEPAAYTAAWHHRHLYDPRSVNGYSIMPSFRFLYEKRRVTGERSAEALQFNGVGGPGEGWEIVPSYDATALVSYLMSLDQSHELKEVKQAAPAAAPAPGKIVK